MKQQESVMEKTTKSRARAHEKEELWNSLILKFSNRWHHPVEGKILLHKLPRLEDLPVEVQVYADVSGSQELPQDGQERQGAVPQEDKVPQVPQAAVSQRAPLLRGKRWRHQLRLQTALNQVYKEVLNEKKISTQA